MSSLFDSLSNKIEIDVNKTSAELGDFVEKLASYRDSVINEYQRYNIDLNEGIAKIAKANGFNDDQIQRIVEEANTQLYLIKYAEMRRFPDRIVAFPIAKVATVKEIVEKGIIKTAAVIEKKASWEEEGLSDGLNFLNYSKHETMGLAADKNRDIKDILAEKLASEINAVTQELDSRKADFAGNIYTISSALIKYDRANKNAQDIFETMCKEASVRKADQAFIKTAITQQIEHMKEYKLVPENYAFNVELVDIDKEADEFSLGKYSLSKQAATASNATIPIIVTDNGTVIRQVRDLVDMARNIQRDKDGIQAAEDKKDKLTNIKKA